jgi:hypothetical protein
MAAVPNQKKSADFPVVRGWVFIKDSARDLRHPEYLPGCRKVASNC